MCVLGHIASVLLLTLGLPTRKMQIKRSLNGAIKRTRPSAMPNSTKNNIFLSLLPCSALIKTQTSTSIVSCDNTANSLTSDLFALQFDISSRWDWRHVRLVAHNFQSINLNANENKSANVARIHKRPLLLIDSF